jgi:hypothetical protein
MTMQKDEIQQLAKQIQHAYQARELMRPLTQTRPI